MAFIKGYLGVWFGFILLGCLIQYPTVLWIVFVMLGVVGVFVFFTVRNQAFTKVSELDDKGQVKRTYYR